MEKDLICMRGCQVKKGQDVLLSGLDWTMKSSETWLVIGSNGSGKEDFIKAMSGSLEICPGQEGKFHSEFSGRTAVVSLEEAARLIEEERARDESEYMDKIDIGRTGREYIYEVIGGPKKKSDPLPKDAYRLESFAQVKLCGVEKILDRGLRFMSTGEIRRTLLCRSLLSGAKLIILSDPFAGLDSVSRNILMEFFNMLLKRQSENSGGEFPGIILCMERFSEIPEQINRVLEFSGRRISFQGTRSDYEKRLSLQAEEKNAVRKKEMEEFLCELKRIRAENSAALDSSPLSCVPESLVRFEDVNVGWDGINVLENLSWEVKKGQHFLVRGPNGSGKTTIMELITGDNMQVFREKIFLFGKRRGSGESIWDIKKHLGIVSYRLHVEYRMVGGTSLQNVIVSGFKDSIGLYEPASDFELAAAKAWLRLAGFSGRENETFASLSYGEQRAVLILRAAVKSPHLLILDEPCHGLDENFREKILGLLETIAETGTTTLLHVTHEPSEVLACEKNILELLPGQSPMYKIICS
ncbi:ATP-binding cassette domain-containing protein [Treponema sp.]|uniref:ATP-binding cassette domain-containing protein n=1 Tax=Treponema sp. TaxID=166 RepID=UPI003F0520FD